MIQKAQSPATPPPTAFDFVSFARTVYTENPDAHEVRFLLPALYGGSSSLVSTFKALIVLEAPSVSFTEQRWKTCAEVEEAINRHREIFFQWAYVEPQARLFRILAGTPPGPTEFFQRVYITDVWKDAAFQRKLKRDNPSYGRYWRSKLELELKSVAAERVVLIGAHARRSGYGYVPAGIPRHWIDFPSWRNKDFEAQVKQIEAQIQAGNDSGND